MQISASKYLILTSALEERVTEQLVSTMHIEVKSYESGIKYLGFYLKENSYSYEDWAWIVKKIQNQISSWSHQWLSRGGKLVLINSVLSSILSFLGNYCKNSERYFKQGTKSCFQFLWRGSKDNGGSYLVKWKRITPIERDRGMGDQKYFLVYQNFSC
jgi:hypothetical protein